MRKERAAVTEPRTPAADGAPAEPENAAGAAAPPNDAVTIDQVIEQLEKEESQAEVGKETADSTLADKQNRLVALRAAQRDFDTNKGTYAAAYDQFTRDQKGYEDYVTSETTRLKTVLGTTADEVHRRATAVTDESAALEKAVDDGTTAVADAQTARDSAKTDALAKAAVSADLNKLAGAVSARLGRLKAWQDEIAKAEQTGHDALAYYLLTERSFEETVAAEPKVIGPDELSGKLIVALDEQAKAEQTLAAAERAVTKSKADLAAAQTRLKDHQATSDADLRRDLTQLAPEGDKPHA
jgi:hypothetical protein